VDPVIQLLARSIQPRRGQAWHGGPTPVGAVRGVMVEEARWRPAPGRHTIWELTLHAAYWKYAIRRRLLGAEIPRFARSPANWPGMPEPADAAAWAADKTLLADEHQLLLETVEDFPARLLGRHAGGRKRWSFGDLIVGIAMHDAYHAGQVQLMKRLWAAR
jgi:hypothetical protein